MRRSASWGVWTVLTISKYSEAARRLTAACVWGDICDVTTTVRTFFTSVVMAKPKMNISTMGMPNSISIVRLSRRMCFASFMTNDINCFIIRLIREIRCFNHYFVSLVVPDR